MTELWTSIGEVDKDGRDLEKSFQLKDLCFLPNADATDPQNFKVLHKERLTRMKDVFNLGYVNKSHKIA